MKYTECDVFNGLLQSCYMDPSYHPACMCCVDRTECYGKEGYALFKEKALIMSELLDNPDCLNPKNALHIAEALDIPDFVNIIEKILKGAYYPDSKIRLLMALTLDMNKVQSRRNAA